MQRYHFPSFRYGCILLALWLGAAACSASPGAVEAATNLVENAKLNAQDQLRFRILEDPVKSKSVPVLVVSAAGDVEFPISEEAASTAITLEVRGKTLAEVREALKKKLEEDYYKKATITLEVVNRVQKAGEAMIYGKGMLRTVTVPLPSDEKTTLFKAVMKANPSEWAKLSKVKLMRLDPASKKTIDRVFDLEKMKKGNLNDDIELKDGDQIEVPEKGIIP